MVESQTVSGGKTGTPLWGKMEVLRFQVSLPGHEDCGTILTVYNIPHGIQGPEHPDPGKPFTARGFPASATIQATPRATRSWST